MWREGDRRVCIHLISDNRINFDMHRLLSSIGTLRSVPSEASLRQKLGICHHALTRARADINEQHLLHRQARNCRCRTWYLLSISSLST